MCTQMCLWAGLDEAGLPALLKEEGVQGQVPGEAQALGDRTVLLGGKGAFLMQNQMEHSGGANLFPLCKKPVRAL